MAELTANQPIITSGSPSGGGQDMISFDGMEFNNSTKKVTGNLGVVAGGDLEWKNQTTGTALLIDVSTGRLSFGSTDVSLNTKVRVDSDTDQNPLFVVRNTSGTTGADTAMSLVKKTDQTSHSDGFGPKLSFQNFNTVLGFNTPGTISAVRTGGSNSKGKLVFQTLNGSLSDNMELDEDGNLLLPVLTASLMLGTDGDKKIVSISKETITGSRGGNAALADLLTSLATQNLIIDSTSA